MKKLLPLLFALLLFAFPVCAQNSGYGGPAKGFVSAHNISTPSSCTTTNTSNAYSCTTAPSFVPVVGDQVNINFNATNTGAATLAVNGASALPIYKWGATSALIAGDIQASHWCRATMDSNGYWQLEGQLGNGGTTVNASTKISTTGPLGTTLSLQGNPFVTGLAGWTDSGSQWSFSSGAAAHAAGASADTLTSGTAVVSGQSYLLTYTVTQTSGAGVVASFGGISDSTRSTTGTYTKYGTASATTALVFTPQAATAVFSVSAVTLQPVGPALTSCGTGPALQQGSSNVAGRLTTGSSTGTACTVTFATAFTNAPSCVCSGQTLCDVATTNSTLSLSGLTSSDTYMYHCIGLNE